MYSRSNSLILSIPRNDLQRQPFTYNSMPRSKEPEVFTFEQIPDEATQRTMPPRQRRRNIRVMYPSKVRKYLPPAEKNPIKRWLIVLCLVVFLQIYTEEPCSETLSVPESPVADVLCEEASFAQYQILPFQSAEEQARQMRGLANQLYQKSQEMVHEENSSQLLNTCPSWESEMARLYEQSRRNTYVVALLYPVYHQLGSEK